MNPTDPTPGKPPRRELFPMVAAPTAVDPVCGMTVDPTTAPASAVYEGRTYFFCCPSCATKFRADPMHYLAPPARLHLPNGPGGPPGPPRPLPEVRHGA